MMAGIITKLMDPEASSLQLNQIVCNEMDKVIDCISNTTSISNNTGHCEVMWSFDQCYPATPYGHTVRFACSGSTSNDTMGTLAKHCNASTGDWGHTNKTECIAQSIVDSNTAYQNFPPFNEEYYDLSYAYDENESAQEASEEISQGMLELLAKFVAAGHGLSLIALVNAIILFQLLRRLHCTRIHIHQNLMASFILRGALWILHTVALKEDESGDEVHATATSVLSNTITDARGHRPDDIGHLMELQSIHCNFKKIDYRGCRLYYVALNYCITANYYWLLVEGIYLKLLLRAFVFKQSKYFKMFFVFGWVMPLLSVIPWLLGQILDEDEENLCWVSHRKAIYWWIITGPILLSLLINFYVFVTVLIVVGSKLRATTSVNQADDSKWRLTKATLALIPLLGIQYLITAFWNKNTSGTTGQSFAKNAFEVIYISIQGLLVAVIYCFLNKEVREECRKKWEIWKTGKELDKNHRRRSTFHTQISTNLISKVDDKLPFEASVVTKQNTSAGGIIRQNNDQESNSLINDTQIKDRNRLPSDDEYYSSLPPSVDDKIIFQIEPESTPTRLSKYLPPLLTKWISSKRNNNQSSKENCCAKISKRSCNNNKESYNAISLKNNSKNYPDVIVHSKSSTECDSNQTKNKPDMNTQEDNGVMFGDCTNIDVPETIV